MTVPPLNQVGVGSGPPGPLAPGTARWPRVAVTLLLAVLGLRAFRDEYGRVPLLSGIDLAIHEFGHMLFMPFGIPVLGETMVILGGSLTQVALPLVFVGYFARSRGHRDMHAATVCFWWAAMNVLSVAIYAADARARELTLISGATGQEDDSGHDFFNLFLQWGVLGRDTVYGYRLRGIALLMFLVSIVAGLWYGYGSGSGNGNGDGNGDGDGDGNT
ncbi:MAG TPA: hypothetical protein VFO55_01670 [Gemmatimonadaceae bacterium]|nr:hypothetical protein [Gemmatimonadaceae bacterium]